MSEWEIGVKGQLEGRDVSVGVYDDKIVGDPIAAATILRLIDDGRVVRPTAAAPAIKASKDPVAFFLTCLTVLDPRTTVVLAGEDKLADLQLDADAVS